MLLNNTNLSFRKEKLFRQIVKAYELTINIAFGN